MDKNIKNLKGAKSDSDNELDMIAFLNEKQVSNKKEVWAKLDKTTKIVKINEFIENIFKVNNGLNANQAEKCKKYLQDCIDKKRLMKNKDVTYKDEHITSVANFVYNKLTQKCSISTEKRISTLRLPDLKKLNKKHNKTKNGGENVIIDTKKIIIKDAVSDAVSDGVSDAVTDDASNP